MWTFGDYEMDKRKLGPPCLLPWVVNETCQTSLSDGKGANWRQVDRWTKCLIPANYSCLESGGFTNLKSGPPKDYAAAYIFCCPKTLMSTENFVGTPTELQVRGSIALLYCPLGAFMWNNRCAPSSSPLINFPYHSLT